MSKPSINLVSQAGFARRLGVSRQYVHQLVSIGLITLDKDGLIDSAKAVHAIEAAQDPARPRTRSGGEAEDLAGASYHEARALKERYAALLRKLEYERLSGELIPAEEIVGAWQQLVAAFRSRILSLPSKLAPQVEMRESRYIQTTLTAAVREALEELSQFRLPRRRARGNGSAKPEPGGPRRPRTAPVH